MNGYVMKDILANWMYQRGMYKDNEMDWEKYKKLSESLEELEKLIIERLPQGGVLSEYAKVSRELKHPIGSKTYSEIRRIYELCNGRRYFDVSEIDEVMSMEYKKEFKEEKFAEIMMDIIARCPASVDNKYKLYNAQRYLFRIGSENEVWFAYRNGFCRKRYSIYACKDYRVFIKTENMAMWYPFR